MSKKLPKWQSLPYDEAIADKLRLQADLLAKKPGSYEELMLRVMLGDPLFAPQKAPDLSEMESTLPEQ